MNRRQFLTRAVPTAAFPFVVGGIPIRAFGRTPLLDALTAPQVETNRVLVLVQLSGGNDGLNMVFPLDQYSALNAARSNMLMPEASILKLTAATGIHPSMAGLRGLYTAGKLVVVQSVSYPNPNMSHFRATDIWTAASDSNQVLDTGWLGRYLAEEFVGFPTGYPSTTMPDPLAIQVGSVVSSTLQSTSGSMGMAVADPNASYILPGGADTPPNTPAGHELSFIRQIAQQTQKYTDVVKTAASKVTNKSTLYPAANQNTLADQLKIVARLVAGGLKTRVYVVSLGGFDTHSAQVTDGTPATGTHATLLGKISDAITAFQDDIRLLGVEDRVIGMTFSEFGRRIKSNASRGTDHGTAAPLFVFGSLVQGGVLGSNPVIPAAATVNDNVAMQYDFRSVYASMIRNWFGAPPAEVQRILPNHTDTLPIIKPSAITSAGGVASIPDELFPLSKLSQPVQPGNTSQLSVAGSQ